MEEIITGNSQQRGVATQARNWMWLHEAVRHKWLILWQFSERSTLKLRQAASWFFACQKYNKARMIFESLVNIQKEYFELSCV